MYKIVHRIISNISLRFRINLQLSWREWSSRKKNLIVFNGLQFQVQKNTFSLQGVLGHDPSWQGVLHGCPQLDRTWTQGWLHFSCLASFRQFPWWQGLMHWWRPQGKAKPHGRPQKMLSRWQGTFLRSWNEKEINIDLFDLFLTHFFTKKCGCIKNFNNNTQVHSALVIRTVRLTGT